MYIPDTARNMVDLTNPEPIRLGLQGAPGSGKTTSALTFPNPIVCDFDNKLRNFKGSPVHQVPFWSDDFIRNVLKITNAGYGKLDNKEKPANRRDAIKVWLRKEAIKFTGEQTLVIDSWTMLQAAFDQQTLMDCPLGKNGEMDGFAFYRLKGQYSADICEILKGLQCNVVVTFHETIERDDEGRATGKINPLMTGKFADQIQGHFTDFFRQLAVDVKDPAGKSTGVTQFLWQIRPSGLCNCSTTIKSKLQTVPADYKSFSLV